MTKFFLAGLFALGFYVSALAQDANTVTPPAQDPTLQKDHENLKGDQTKVDEAHKALHEKREERNAAQKDVRQDREQLHKDVKAGASADAVAADKAKLQDARKARDEKQKEVREARHELNADRKARHEDHAKLEKDRKERRKK